MQLLILVVVLCAVSLSDAASHAPLERPWLSLAAVALGACSVAGFAAAAVGWTRSAVPCGWQDVAEPEAYWAARRALARFSRLRNAHTLLWLIVSGLVLLQFDWPQLVLGNLALDRFPLLDKLVLLAPILLPLLISWGLFYDVDRRAFPRALSPAAGRPITRCRYVGLYARHYLLLSLGPLLALLLVYDVAKAWLDASLDGPWGWAVLSAVLAGLFLAFPRWVKWAWSAEPLEQCALRDSLYELARHAGVRIRDIWLWPTGGAVANAAAVGLAGKWRYVLLSDGLVRRLSAGQLEAVFGHELGHLKAHHLLRRAAAIALPLFVWLAVPSGLQGELSAAMAAAISQVPWLSAGLVAALAAPLLVSAYVITIFAAYSRQLELEADWLAVQTLALAGRTQDAATADLDSALVKLLPGESARTHFMAFHPSLAVRRHFLRRWLASPEAGLAFQARLRRREHAVVLAVGIALLSRFIF